MAKIIWHCGFQKTGTTSIQTMLLANQNLLADHAHIFPRHESTLELRQACLEYWNTGATADQRDVASAVRSICSSIDDRGLPIALVSDENILGKNIYSSWNSVLEFAQKVMHVIANAADPHECEFIFYTREMNDWLKSAYNQEVTAVRMRDPFEVWHENIPFIKDWDEMLAVLTKNTNLNIIFRDMAKDMKRGKYLGSYLLERCEVPKEIQARVVPVKVENPSLPASALDFMVHVNNLWMNNRDVKRVRQLVVGNRHLFAEDPVE